MLIHGFWLVNARLLMAFGTAFYAITTVKELEIAQYQIQFCYFPLCFIKLKESIL